EKKMSKDIKLSGTSYPSSTNFVIKMWIRFEGEPSSMKLKANVSQVTDLDDFRDILRSKFEELKDIKNQRIIFLDYNNVPLSPDTCLQNLVDNTTAKTPLLVRYPLSNANSKCKIPHTSGSLSLLREEVVKRFKELQTEEFYFFNEETKDEIRNEYSFNILVSQIEPNGNNYNLKLKVKVEGDIPRFNVDDLPPLKQPFSENELKIFIEELRTTFNAFHKEFGTNEPTACVYINAFMKVAVCYIQDHINKSAKLSVEIPLDGSRGYGPVDYIVEIVRILVLLYEAKSEDMNKGTAQVLVQMHSAMERQLRKYKFQMEPTIFGIVTTGKLWRFVRWTGSLESPTVHITEEFTCNFIDNMEFEKKVLRYIAQILQAQAMIFGDDNKDNSHPSKRQCTNQENDK
ncbi:16622_t:CDS:2, partial [Gigaspora margarita]